MTDRLVYILCLISMDFEANSGATPSLSISLKTLPILFMTVVNLMSLSWTSTKPSGVFSVYFRGHINAKYPNLTKKIANLKINFNSDQHGRHAHTVKTLKKFLPGTSGQMVLNLIFSIVYLCRVL